MDLRTLLTEAMSVLRRLAALLRPFERDTHTGRHDLVFQAEGAFTGICHVREYTADGAPAGRCNFGTKEGRCPRHGDVTLYLLCGQNGLWPRDFELERYDGQAWAEQLRREIHDRDTE